eukprot:scaffold10314_cov33-Phaeocystis_antarctica.AAC.1
MAHLGGVVEEEADQHAQVDRVELRLEEAHARADAARPPLAADVTTAVVHAALHVVDKGEDLFDDLGEPVAVRARVAGEDGDRADDEDAQDAEHARGEHHRNEDGEAAVQPPGAPAGGILVGAVSA